MPLISGTIPSLINGISQQPATLRMPTQGELQENGMPHISRGLEKRPSTEHVTEVSGITSADSNDVFIHTIRRSEDEAYALVIKGGQSSYKTFTGATTNVLTASGHTLVNGDEVQFTTDNTLPSPLAVLTSYYVIESDSVAGTFEVSATSGGSAVNITGTGSGTHTIFLVAQVKLIDLTGFATGTAGSEVFIHTATDTGEVTTNEIINPTVNTYLSNFGPDSTFTPNKLSCTTIADFTFILNKTQTVKQSDDSGDRSPMRDYEGMIYMRVGDYGADYKVTLTEYNVNSTTGEVNKDSILSQYTVTYKTPDNETESKTISGTTKAINNQEAVVVSNIAQALKTGIVTHLNKVHLITDDASPPTEVFIAISTATTATADSTVDNQVKSLGEVATATIEGTDVTSGGLAGIAGVTGSNYTVTYVEGESTINISNDTYPFTIEVTDGKGDTYMRAINGSDEVPNFGYLPGSKVTKDFTARVSGDKSSGQDDYYVKWNGSVWKETIKPLYPGGSEANDQAALEKEARIKLDPATMPMQIHKAFDTSGDIYFVLKPVAWDAKKVGDQGTNPFPSFANYDSDVDTDGLYTINDIFFHRNRLGFVSDENVILSEAGSYYNFWATTILSVLDTAVIDVAVSNNQVAILKSAIPFKENLVLFSDLQQFKLSSDAFLTPTSVTVDVATNFETSTEAKPVGAGKTIFFPFKRGAFSGIREYQIDIASETNDAQEITSHIPEYIEGTVKKLASSSNEEVLYALSDANRKLLFVYKYYYSDQEKLQSSWSSWLFDADIIDMEFIGSVAFVLFRRGTKIYLEKINLSVDNANVIMDDQIGVRLDRRVALKTAGSTQTTAGSIVFAGGDWEDNKTYTNVTGNGSLSGKDIKFTIVVNNTNGNPVFTVTGNGSGFVVGETVTITDPGSSSATGTVTITTVGVGLTIPYSDVNHDVVGSALTNSNLHTLKTNVPTPIGTLFTFEANISTEVLTANAAHSIANNSPVKVSSTGTLPAPLEADKTYYVREVDGSALKLSAASGPGPAINIETTGEGTHSIRETPGSWGINQSIVQNLTGLSDKAGTGLKVSYVTDADGQPTFTVTDNGTGYVIGEKITFTDSSVSTIYTAIVEIKTISNQFGTKISIDGTTNTPRIDQTLTIGTLGSTIYTVTGVQDGLTANSYDITITPSIAKDQALENNTSLTFVERNIVYVAETGEIVKAADLANALANGTLYSKAKGNTSPVIFAGIPYNFKYQFSEQFVKQNDQSINSGRLQLRNFEVSFAKSGFFEVEVSPKPYDPRLRIGQTKQFTGQLVGTSILGIRKLETGVFRVPVYCNSKDVKITVNSDQWFPLALQSADWEAYQVLRNQRI